MEGIYSSKELKFVVIVIDWFIEKFVEKKESKFILNIKVLFEKLFCFIVMEFVIFGLVISLFLVILLILYFVGLSKFIKVEILFCILYGIIFGLIKGVFLGVIVDVLVLLLMGRIGLWYWIY